MLVLAPAGYAKTSVLAEWAVEDDRPFAWVSLDSRDNDATRLLNRFVEAVDGVSLKGRPFVLVVDNADVVRTKGASDALSNLIASLCTDGQIALASRREPRLPLGRMRAQREVFELTRRDLAMSRTESAALLEELGLKLSPEETEALHERIEGWPAVSRLAGLFLAQQLQQRASGLDCRRLRGRRSVRIRLFQDEFLSVTSPARLRFLMRSSILEDLAGQICDEVMQRSGSAWVLRELARSNLPLDQLRSQRRAPIGITRSSSRRLPPNCVAASPSLNPTCIAEQASGTQTGKGSSKLSTMQLLRATRSAPAS